MLKVSSKSTYAIRALVQLARESKASPVRLASIAEHQRIPLPYLEQIFSKLRRAGVVESIRGPQGGYKLTKNPGDISLEHIITILEGPLDPVLCTMPENRSPTCHEIEGCVSRVLCNELDGNCRAFCHGIPWVCWSSKPIKYTVKRSRTDYGRECLNQN